MGVLNKHIEVNDNDGTTGGRFSRHQPSVQLLDQSRNSIVPDYHLDHIYITISGLL